MRRSSSAESLHVHQPRFSFCEPENPSSPPPKRPEPPPTLDELLIRARAQRRRAIREEDFDIVQQLDADIERLLNALGKSRGRTGPRLAQEELERLRAKFGRNEVLRTKRTIFGDSQPESSSSDLEEYRPKGRGRRRRPSPLPSPSVHWPDLIGDFSTESASKASRAPYPDMDGIYSELEERANHLDWLLSRALAHGKGIFGNEGKKSKSPEAINRRTKPARRRRSASQSPENWLIRPIELSPDIGWAKPVTFTRLSSPPTPFHPMESPELRERECHSSSEVLAKIRQFDLEMGIPRAAHQRKKRGSQPRRRTSVGRRASSPFAPSPIWPLNEANMAPELGWMADVRMGQDGQGHGHSAFASSSRGERNEWPEGASSPDTWSIESPFAPPKGFHHQRKARRTRQSMAQGEEQDSPRLPTPPGLRDDGQQTSPPPESPMLDRDQFLVEINPADRGFASRTIDLFGLDTVANIYAKDWAERKTGLEQVLARLRAADGGSREMLETAIPVLKRALQDQLFQVFSAGMDLFHFLLGRLSSSSADGRLQRKFASATAQTLANRIGDRPSDKRFGQLCLNAFGRVFVRGIADPKGLANFFLLQLLNVLNNGSSHHLTSNQTVPELTHLELGRVEAVAKGVKALWGTGASSCNEFRLCPFLGLCLASPDPEIRTIGREMAEWLYTHGNGTNRRLIRQYLPMPVEEDVTARAKVDFRQLALLHAFWEAVDGGKT